MSSGNGLGRRHGGLICGGTCGSFVFRWNRRAAVQAGTRVAIDGALALWTALGRLSFGEWENMRALRAFARVGPHCLGTIRTGLGATGGGLCACISVSTTIYTRLAGVVN